MTESVQDPDLSPKVGDKILVNGEERIITEVSGCNITTSPLEVPKPKQKLSRLQRRAVAREQVKLMRKLGYLPKPIKF